MSGIYNITVDDLNGNKVEMSKYKGRVMLIVNSATQCFFTPQYEMLETLYAKYKDMGLSVLDFPCNQFGENAPEDIVEIDKFCTSKFNTTFDRFEKVEVNGIDESILYTYLKRHQKGLFNTKIKWNFTKFLVDQEGRVLKRYTPLVKMSVIEKDILDLLKKK